MIVQKATALSAGLWFNVCNTRLIGVIHQRTIVVLRRTFIHSSTHVVAGLSLRAYRDD